MRLANYISKRIARGSAKSFSATIIRISYIAIALSVASIIIGLAFINGFQKGVQNKFYENWGHIHIAPFLADPSNLLQEETFSYDSKLIESIRNIPGVKHVAPFGLHSVIVKSKDEIEGLALKAYNNNSDFDIIQSKLIEGTIPTLSDTTYSKQIILSQSSAKKLKVQLQDKLLLYFLVKNESTPKIRKVNISGIYSTGLEEFDKSIALCDQKLLNNIRGDSVNHIQAIEVFSEAKINNENLKDSIYTKYLEAPLYAYTVKERFHNVFTWLGMLSVNKSILISIMLIVAIMNIISTLLILILERTQMIGILKSLGMPSFEMIKIFFLSGLKILLIGLILGNLVGQSIILLQQQFEFIRLNPEVYYVQSAPVFIDWLSILFVNLFMLAVMFCIMILPVLIIKTITPVKALKFE